MFENVKGVIFDLDGTLVDSLWVWNRIDQDFIQHHGLGITPAKLMKDVAHFSFEQTAHHFKEVYGLEDSLEDIKDYWNTEAEREYTSNVRLKPGVREFLDRMRGKNIPMAIATSSSRHLLTTCLKANDILNYFQVIVTTDESKARSKREPDVYLLAADRLGISPRDVVVFEDIPHAMQGARRAGMKVVGVWDSHTDLSEEEAAFSCDLYIRDFTVLLEKGSAASEC